MGGFAAKQGDQVVGTDVLVVMVPTGPSLVATQLLHPFTAQISGGLSDNVMIMGMAAATVNSTADNVPSHAPMSPGTGFQAPPRNQSEIEGGSTTVKISGRAAARDGDPARTGNELTPTPAGTVVAAGSVRIGG
jgi:uncharacterized Zn-binding protein involved in type VI secretion